MSSDTDALDWLGHMATSAMNPSYVQEAAAHAAAEVRTLRTIVADLTAGPPMVLCDDDMGDQWYECGFCEVTATVIHRAPADCEPAEVEHRESCLWRRAREVVGGQG